MTKDEERHADEVNIAFQMGAEWQMKRSEAAWKGVHEGAVLALQARVEQLEAALREVVEAAGDPSAYMIARAALGGDKKND